jgi:hypothetical protein
MDLQTSHAATPTVTHHGFSEEQIKRIFEEAGVGKDFALEEAAVVFFRQAEGQPSIKRRIFFARGTKA